MDIYFITYYPECGETFLSLFPVGEQSIDIIVRAVAKLRLGNYNLRIENGNIPPLNSLGIWEFVNAAAQMKLKTKYTFSYLAIDMMQLENL